MNLQELLQGVLSGKFTVPQGALGALGPGSPAPWRTNYLDQQQPAPPQQAPLPLGPYAVHPGLQQALQPGQQVAQPGAGDALRNFQNGVLSPQPDPGAPTAAPQPGNGVLAQNNAAAMAQAAQGPPPAPQATDGSAPPPQVRPALAPPAPDTAKAPAKPDAVTRGRGILAAAASGDPRAFSQAVTDPAAAAQAGAQTPDSAWNERSSYDGQSAVSPTTPDGKPKPLSDQHEADKQQTFGQKFMGALANPDTQDLLQSIGIGLLSNPNAMQGMAEGMKMYQALHLRRQQRDLEQQRVDVENKRADIADKRAQTQLDQGQQQIELSKGDQAIRRTSEEDMARYRAQQLQGEAAGRAEAASFHRGELANSAAGRNIELERMRLEMGQPVSSQILPSADGTGAYSYSRYRDGRTEVTKLPDGVAAGLSLVNPQAREDAKGETKLVTSGSTALKGLDETSQVDNILAKDPNGVGPSAKAGIYRWLATTLGLPGSDPIQELRQLKATGQIDQAVGMSGQRMTDNARSIIKEAVSNIDTMGPELLKKVNDAKRESYLGDLAATEAYLKAHPERASSPAFTDYVTHRDRMNLQGGARSGATASGGSVSGKLSNGLEFQFTPGG